MNTVQKLNIALIGSRSVLGPIVVGGFLGAVVIWCVAFLTHFPGLEVSAPAAAAAVMTAWVVVAVWNGSLVERRRAVVVGLGSGLVTALLSVLILGSMLVEQPTTGAPAPGAQGLRPAWPVSVLGFLALGGVIGLVGGLVGAAWSKGAKHRSRDWLARFAVVAVCAIAPLLLIGGAVTSTNSGMAIVGWPDSYGANMFLYPVSLMTSDPHRFLEHSHRLFGSLTGLTTLTLMVWVLIADRRRWLKGLAIGLFAFVCVQGVLGGRRVNLDSRYLALIHGISAQLIAGMCIAIASVLSPSFKQLIGAGDGPAAAAPAIEDGRWRRLRVVTTGLLHSTLLQLLMGASYRHLKMMDSKGASHALLGHAAFSLVVVGFAITAGFMLRTAAARGGLGVAGPTLRRVGAAMLAVVGVQFVLGWAALWAVNGEKVGGAASWVQPLIATLHQANGAAVLGLATMGFVWVRGVGRGRGMAK